MVATVNGEFTVKRYTRTESGVILEAANPRYPNLHLSVGDEFSIWGVVRHCIHQVDHRNF